MRAECGLSDLSPEKLEKAREAKRIVGEWQRILNIEHLKTYFNSISTTRNGSSEHSNPPKF